jgi:DNA repair exonuclease SbcCD ATPase subunit
MALKSATQEKPKALTSLQLSRQVTIKHVVTDDFKARALKEFSDELKLIEAQIQQLDNQHQQGIKQLESLSQQGQNVQKQLVQLNGEVQDRRTQLENAKMQLSRDISNIEKSQNGNFVVTGTLETQVTVSIGDVLSEKLGNLEIIVKDGVIDEIVS